MKVLHVPMDDSDYHKLKKAKEELKMTWPEFILQLVEPIQLVVPKETKGN